MADYTTLSDASVGIGGIPSGTTVTALRDNPIAIAEGAAGAPNIQFAALGAIAAGTSVKLSKDSLSTRSQNTFAQLVKVGIFQPGSVRLTLEHRNSGFSASSIVEVLENDVVVQTWTTSSTSYVARSLDVSTVVGDDISVRHRCSDDGTSSFSDVQLIRFQTTGASIWPLFTIGIEDVAV